MTPSPKRVLITGGAGLVGSSLASRFREKYPIAEVLCLDNLYRKGSELNRRRVEAAGVTFIYADVRDAAAFDIEPCDWLIDAAAEPSVTPFER
jgi:CDP-paratose 2-epimerase